MADDFENFVRVDAYTILEETKMKIIIWFEEK